MKKKDSSKMTQKYKKVQTVKTVTRVYKCTYFIDSDEPDTDCLCYEPSDEELLKETINEEVS